MQEPEVLVPITCPKCGRESVGRLAVSMVADALIADKSLMLASRCHAITWPASARELEQIREYLMAACIDLHGAGSAGRAGAPR